MSATDHRILRLWTRPEEAGSMNEQTELSLLAGQGVFGDHTFGRMRHVTLVFEDDWNEACRELGREVDPVGRRANVLLSGGAGGRLIGARISVGGATIHVRGETRPCPVMDRAAAGLKDALRPNVRAGVWGRVESAGTLRIGDEMTIVEEAAIDHEA